jgi:hypothetical protein
MNTTSRNPDSVSRVNITPLARCRCAPCAGSRPTAPHRCDRSRGARDRRSRDRCTARRTRLDRLDHLVDAAHVEVGLLLAGEGGLRQVFGGRRGAHRHRDIGSVGGHLCRRIRESRSCARGAGSRGPTPGSPSLWPPGHRRHRCRGHRVEHLDPVAEPDPGPESRGMQAPWSRNPRNLDTEPGELADHFAKRRVLAADTLDVAHSELVKLKDVLFHDGPP